MRRDRRGAARRPGWRLTPTVLITAAFFTGLVMFLPATQRQWFTGFYALMSAISFSLYGLDKRASTRGGWRTSEARLHLVELLGGWPGALLAQRVFRHKTRKRSFQVMSYLAVAVNLVALGWLIFADNL